MSDHSRIRVQGARPYDVVIGRGLLEELQVFCPLSHFQARDVTDCA